MSCSVRRFLSFPNAGPSAQNLQNPHMPLTRSIFRAFIAAGNLPQSAEDIYARIKKGSPQVILKELLSVQMENDGIVVV